MPDYQTLESLNLLEPQARPAHDNDRDSDAERRTNAQSRSRDIRPKHPGLK